MPSPRVDIAASGRGGSITYHEGDRQVGFSWEFAMPPAIALVFGTGAAGWDAAYPWAAGRQEEIYEFVAAEVIRQKVSDGSWEIDLEGGTIEIQRLGSAAAERQDAVPSPALEAFKASVLPVWREWGENEHYDLEALIRLSEEEIPEAVALLTSRDVTWREVDALALLDSPAADAALHDALRHHLRIDTRLAAAEVLKLKHSSFDLESVLARQIRALHRPDEGLERALRLGRDHDAPVIRQALLWASYNCTDCAPACAGLLLTLTGAAIEPFDTATQALLGRLGYHNSSNDRGSAFEELSRRVGMVLDTSVSV